MGFLCGVTRLAAEIVFQSCGFGYVLATETPDHERYLPCKTFQAKPPKNHASDKKMSLQDVYWDQDGSLTGTANSQHGHNIGFGGVRG